MRDRQMVEELSVAAAVGLWADDVVLAVDRIMHSPNTVATEDSQLLMDAAATVDQARRLIDEPMAATTGIHDVASMDASLTLASALLQEERATNSGHVFERIARTLRSVADASVRTESDEINKLLAVFARIAEIQLRESSAFLIEGTEGAGWPAIL